MQFEIKNRFTGAVQFTAEIDATDDTPLSLKIGLSVKWAIKTRANLASANLTGAYLAGADLADAYLAGADLAGARLAGADLTGAGLARANLASADLAGAYLVDGGQRSDGYRFVGWIKDGALQIRAGCRNFTITEAREHWTETRGGTPLVDETMCILDHIEAVARIRGLIPAQEEK